MNEPVQQHSDIIEQLQSKIQALTDENRLLKQRMDEAAFKKLMQSAHRRRAGLRIPVLTVRIHLKS
jgi:hypothetical protein